MSGQRQMLTGVVTDAEVDTALVAGLIDLARLLYISGDIRGGKVYLRKRCREHGVFEALVYGDAQMYLDSARFNKPGTIPLRFQTEVREGCPSDCGLCPEHKQHACLGIIEVNTGCNLDCPICFADSGHQPDGYSITVEQCVPADR